MKKQVNIGLIGFGVVGSGTMQLLKDNKKEIETRVGAELNVRWVCSLDQIKPSLIFKETKRTKRWHDVIEDPNVDCVVELIGGSHPAREVVMTALHAGKHVVTANKAIMAIYWKGIIGLSHRKKRLIYFEASVGGGIPVVQALNEGLAGNQVKKIIGILNGTTNFILTQMAEKGMAFEEAVSLAQASGFAEADPTFDVEGIDSAQKIAILGSLALGKWINPSQVHCEGITKLQALDTQLIRERLNSTVKLLAIAEHHPKGWVFRVHPALVPMDHPFANVRNEYNAVSIVGNAVGDVMLYGKGAGRLPAASAVLSDLIFLCRHVAMGTAGTLPFVPHREQASVKMVPMSQIQGRYY
ncbi:hypothetical protein BVX98_01990, partial [bacterium F11]